MLKRIYDFTVPLGEVLIVTTACSTGLIWNVVIVVNVVLRVKEIEG